MSLLGDQISVSASLGVWASGDSRNSRAHGLLGFLDYDEQGGMLSGCRKTCLLTWKARLEISSRLGSCSHFGRRARQHARAGKETNFMAELCDPAR